MRASRRASVLIAVCALVAAIVPAVAQQAVPESARTWIGRAEQIEQFIREAEVVDIEDIGTGVTNPQRAELTPGGLVARIAFKPIRPGNYHGHFESYESEIAAYELDKLLGLGMTPPTVEKRIAGDLGAAVMWAAPTRSFKKFGGSPTAPAAQMARWNYQLIRAKMFHNLIYNKDPNLGNWLVDPAWNLILIDNSRAFTTPRRMVHKLTRVDQDLWDRFMALDEATLKAALGKWLGDGQTRAILERRDQMAKDIEALVADRSAAAVFVRFRPTPASPPQRAVPSSHDEPDRQAVGGQRLSALNETPAVLGGSELTWIGRVVHLAEYEGSEEDIAKAAMASGYTMGIVTELNGLLGLARDAHNPEHYEILAGLHGKQAEVFGLITEDDGLTVVQVTLCREVP